MESRKCFICNYYYLLKVNFIFQRKACDRCNDLMQKAISFIMLQLFLLKDMIIDMIIEFIFGI